MNYWSGILTFLTFLRISSNMHFLLSPDRKSASEGWSTAAIRFTQVCLRLLQFGGCSLFSCSCGIVLLLSACYGARLRLGCALALSMRLLDSLVCRRSLLLLLRLDIHSIRGSNDGARHGQIDFKFAISAIARRICVRWQGRLG